MSLSSTLWWDSSEERMREAERGYVMVKNDPKGLCCLSHCSVAKSYPTLCDLMDCSMPGSHVLHCLLSLLKFMSIESVMLSKHLILCHTLLLLPLIFPSMRVFSSKLVVSIRWPKYWSFSFSISPSSEYSGLVWSPCCPKDSQESFLVPQFEGIDSSVLRLLYSPTFTSIHAYRKNHSFDYTDLCQKSDVSTF